MQREAWNTPQPQGTRQDLVPSTWDREQKITRVPGAEALSPSLTTPNKKGFRLPGCFCLGFGKFVTQVCGHMRMLQGCREPSRKCCLVWEMWIPPSGVFGNVLAGTRARQ